MSRISDAMDNQDYAFMGFRKHQPVVMVWASSLEDAVAQADERLSSHLYPPGRWTPMADDRSLRWVESPKPDDDQGQLPL